MKRPAHGLGAGALALALALTAISPAGATRSAPLEGPSLTRALRQGGYVLVMRHASSPPAPPSAADANPGNVKQERQLDAKGRQTAQAMGAAVAALRLPVGMVWSSPTYRARETARLAGLRAPRIAEQLGDRGKSMQAATSDQAAWLRAKAAVPPRRGTDSFIVTQYPNIQAAFGGQAAGMGDGEALVFRPGRRGASELVARIPIESWPPLAAAGAGHAH